MLSVILAHPYLNFHKHFLLMGKYFYSKTLVFRKMSETCFETLQRTRKKDFRPRLLRVFGIGNKMVEVTVM